MLRCGVARVDQVAATDQPAQTTNQPPWVGGLGRWTVGQVGRWADGQMGSWAEQVWLMADGLTASWPHGLRADGLELMGSWALSLCGRWGAPNDAANGGAKRRCQTAVQTAVQTTLQTGPWGSRARSDSQRLQSCYLHTCIVKKHAIWAGGLNHHAITTIMQPKPSHNNNHQPIVQPN